MKVLFLGNNRVGRDILIWLLEQTADEVVGVVLHPEQRRKHGEEMCKLAHLHQIPVISGNNLNQPEVIEQIRELKAEIAVSAFFGYIIREPLLSMFPEEIINIHPGYLPYNRGACPNVWSIVDQTPAGVTMHYIDEGVDTGDLIARQIVPVEPDDTGATLYARLEEASVQLFRQTWPRISRREAERIPQSGSSTTHRMSELAQIDRIDPDQMYRAEDLINILRARTFPPYQGAYLELQGKRVYLRLELETESSE